MLAWSFVRADQPLGDTARQVAFALRDEIGDLEAAGIRIIQVDEPALRELLPLRRAGHECYLDWAVGAFRLATSGVADSTQIHTHMCYSEFGEIIGAIGDLDADVTSVGAARSRAARELAGALRLLGQPEDGWATPVVTCSAATADGLAGVWDLVDDHERTLRNSGELDRQRRDQRVSWMWSLVRDQLLDRLRDSPELRAMTPGLEADVRAGTLTPGLAAQQLVATFLPDPAVPGG